MVTLRPEDILHKSQINRLLIEVVDHPVLSQSLAFKGGTCATMLGYLDRFSVDLDFDILRNHTGADFRPIFHSIFDQMGMKLTLEFEKNLFFQLRYTSRPGQRSTLKVSASDVFSKENRYQVQYFPEIDRLMNSQTIETMFANKLVAITDRFQQHQTIAARDFYDIHHFFIQGYTYQPEIILDRTGLDPRAYFSRLVTFIKKYVNQTLINEDLNTLLPYQKFLQIRKVLIPETLSLLESEISK